MNNIQMQNIDGEYFSKCTQWMISHSRFIKAGVVRDEFRASNLAGVWTRTYPNVTDALAGIAGVSRQRVVVTP